MATEQKTPLINILTYKLPVAVTKPLFSEYNNRLREIANIWSWEKSSYRVLREFEPAIVSLLAMSLFYRHVLGHIQGANSFYKTVKQHCKASGECSIRIGKTVLDNIQQRRLDALLISFNQIQDKYQIYPAFYEFSETAEFLRNCKELLSVREDEKDDTI